MLKQPWIPREEFEGSMSKLKARLDSRGPMSPPSFRAYRNNTQSIASASTEELIHLDTKAWDNRRAFDEVTNHRWTCPVAGRYQFNAGVRINNASGVAADIYVRLRIGGVAGTIFLHPMQQMAVANAGTVFNHGSAQYVFAVNDYVEMYIYTTQQPVTVAGGLYLCYMDAFFLGT